MLYRPSLRSIWTLLILAAICCGLYFWCESSRVQRKMPNYDQKLAASQLMVRCLQSLQETTREKGVFSENYEEPLLDVLIGQQFSLITTDIAKYETKLIGANPNFAAVAVELLERAGVKKGDLVAVALTGSNPGLNTAVLCACDVLGAKPVTITALGASWWGATDPEFTWADMEGLLVRQGILHSQPIAASMGGIDDAAIGLSQMGQEMMRLAAERNGLTFIHESNLPADMARWHRLFMDAAKGNKYKAYVNVGDGVASLGHPENASLISDGLHRRLPVQNYPARGVVHRFSAEGIPIVNIDNVVALSREYGLGQARIPLPPAGQGDVFIADRYDLRVAGLSAFIALILIVLLVHYDARLFRLREAGVDPDTLM
ncbi:poly-gamma-glutamate system protein [bacterium]|nr:poly-gamma-glutamate system protein [bacterium]MBU1983744.1 poly-gamma-glutamate system protein [bacterium]